MGGKNESFRAGGETAGEGSVAMTWWSLTLLHFYFWWSQEGPVFLLFLSLCICLEVSPAVHTTISTFLNTKEV